MRRLSIIALMAAAALMTACGGGSQTISTTGSGSGTGGTGGTGGTTTTYSMGNGTGSGFQSGMIGLSSATLSAGGTTSLDVTIVDQTGTLYTTAPVTVTFNSPCVAQGFATIAASGGSTAGTSPGTVITSTGSVTATYTAKGCSGADVITATATVATKSLTATGTVTVAAASIGSIQFISASPVQIGLKGTGLAETSTVIFKVVDSSGGPRPGVSVALSLNTTVGGISLSPATATSAADGTVQTVVSSGTQHTSVRVTAKIASPALSTQSSVLTVTTGLPASAGFSIAVAAPSYAGSGPACSNVEAYGTDGVTIPVTVRLSDRYNNPAPDGTSVAFNTNGGHIVGACTTPSNYPTLPSAADGTCTVTWTSANPRPQLNSDSPPLKGAGRATILATAIGEESFTDTNGNGYWDTGEPFVHLGEPYRDDNENNAHDSGEFFLDFNQNGAWDAPDPALTAFKGITCTGTPATCSTSTLAIGVSHLLIMSTAQADLTVNSAPGFGGTASTGLTINHSVAANPPAPAQTFTGTLNFTVADKNNNPMAAGTTVGVAADSTIGTVSGPGVAWAIPCNEGPGGDSRAVTLTASMTSGAVGNITITVTSPGTHTATVFTIGVTLN
ncbi:MAG TPA: hypothetical protein VN325_21575 [Steroidobacteraceae bacterium]|nr:hypothetical protein [Steroidobacteraceae bacterium]